MEYISQEKRKAIELCFVINQMFKLTKNVFKIVIVTMHQ